VGYKFLNFGFRSSDKHKSTVRLKNIAIRRSKKLKFYWLMQRISLESVFIKNGSNSY
jgi:hypothetical protein